MAKARRRLISQSEPAISSPQPVNCISKLPKLKSTGAQTESVELVIDDKASHAIEIHSSECSSIPDLVKSPVDDVVVAVTESSNLSSKILEVQLSGNRNPLLVEDEVMAFPRSSSQASKALELQLSGNRNLMHGEDDGMAVPGSSSKASKALELQLSLTFFLEA